MSFNVNIPVVTDPILLSAFQLRANFQAIASAFASNHLRLNDNPDTAGKHRVFTFRPQNSDPATSADQVALYNKLVSSVPQLFYRPNNSQTPIQLTYDSIKVDSSENQYTFIAGPFIVYGGILRNITVGQVVNLSPGTTLLYVDLQAANVSSSFPKFTVLPGPIPTNITGTQFTIYNQAFTTGHLDAYYFAIGV